MFRSCLVRFVTLVTAVTVLLCITAMAQIRDLDDRSSGFRERNSIALPDRECQGVPATGQTSCWGLTGNPTPCSA